jgi:hypothetical protein
MKRRFLLFLFCLVFITATFGQKDSTSQNGILNSKLTKEILRAVHRKPSSWVNEKNVKSEDAFMPYAGKIIRNITVRHIKFEQSIYDTSKNIADVFTRTANNLHVDTRPSVVYNHLFFYVNKPLDPYKLADNERYLRDRDFILDSKISVYSVGNGDSVDVEVMTRDVFSLGFRPRVSSFDKYSFSIYDANLMGRGQRLQGDFLFEGGRTPFVGKGISYSKSSISGSLIDLTVAYTELNRGLSLGEENEYAWYLRLDRPLVSPYSRLAGGFEFSRNWSVNVDNAEDSLFRQYRYYAQDVWTGYNIGIKKDVRDRSRYFVALRYSREQFDRQPMQPEERVRRMYNDNQFLLASFTYYLQNFYKTNYVYGFGRTEDVPYGTTASVTTGWSEELGLRRPYIGGTITKHIIAKSSRFYSVELGGGTFFNDGGAEDGVAYIAGRYFSKLYELRKLKIRHQISGGFGRAFNNRIFDLLTLNNQLREFDADSLYGYQRTFFASETTVFLPGQILGFRFAPFMSVEAANLNREIEERRRRDYFVGLTGGVRVRNENLIFGTVEFRVIYYPNAVDGLNSIAIKVTSNLRIKYSGSFVRPPSFVSYN